MFKQKRPSFPPPSATVIPSWKNKAPRVVAPPKTILLKVRQSSRKRQSGGKSRRGS
jgi:hypothetical protein